MQEPKREIVVIGGSAGSHAALRKLVGRLPADLPAAVLITLHLSPQAPSRLAESLRAATSLPVAAAVDGQHAEPGRIYTAVPDRHLLLTEDNIMRLARTARENLARPAVDALFRTAARWCGPRVIAVVLSGSLDDGAAGAASVAQRGGTVLVQDPQDARFPGMPTAALAAVPSARPLPATELGEAIATAVERQALTAPAPPASLLWEADMLANGQSTIDQPGTPVALGCPECAGGMYLITTDLAVHYACHVGHSYSPQTLLAAREHNVETALWTAISALQEKATVLRELARQAGDRGAEPDRHHYQAAARDAVAAAETLQRHVTDNDAANAATPPG